MLKESFQVTNERIEESREERAQIIVESWEETNQVIEERIKEE